MSVSDACAAPGRIRRKRTKCWRMPEGAVYVGRGTMWGNPFAHRDPTVGARMFRCWVAGTMRTGDLLECRKVLPGPLGQLRARVRAEVRMLRAKTLACWCSPRRPCHADVLLELVNP